MAPMAKNGLPKISASDRITSLEKRVAEQTATISRLEAQLRSLSLVFATAAQCLEIEVIEEVVPDITEAPLEAEEAPTEPDTKKETVIQYNYKNLLQEHSVKKGWQFPTYETVKGTGGFSSEVHINNETFSSCPQKSKVLAEKFAASLALQEFHVIDENGLPIGDSKQNTGISKYSWCKNQLQEYFAKKGQPYPTYVISPVGAGKGFNATVTHAIFPDHVVTGDQANSKRGAEQMAAFKAITEWGILDIEGTS